MPFDLMLVDDSPVMRSFILRAIHMSGFDVGRCLQASDGFDAITQLDRLATEEHSGVNAVLTDINMPRMDGEELVQRIRERSFMEGVPVVVISTDATHARINRLLAIGAQGYVTKPFSPERLRQELDRVLPAAARRELRDGDFGDSSSGDANADSDF